MTLPDKKGGKWQLSEFLDTGKTEIASRLAGLMRILAPGGALVFQLPCAHTPFRSFGEIIKWIAPQWFARMYVRARDGKRAEQPVMETHVIPQDRIVQLLEAHGATVVQVRRDPNFDRRWTSLLYFVSKK